LIERLGNEVRVRGLTGGLPERASDQSAGPVAHPAMVEQCRQALGVGAQILAEAGLEMRDVTRVVYLVHDCDAFAGCFGVLRGAFGDSYPACTLRLVNGFAVRGAEIEIELIVRR
jgi:enamine deaminase RidA (YjgF/YER057c/UK114 family)